jgi:50S ribosomal protein L16 3-hydroxylase
MTRTTKASLAPSSVSTSAGMPSNPATATAARPVLSTVDVPQTLLGGLSAQGFMKKHWQKKPLLVRGALPGFQALLSRAELFALSAREDVESRLIVQNLPPTTGRGKKRPVGSGWTLAHGPFGPSVLPALEQPGWTLLVQGVDLHNDAVHDLLNRFRFVPDARLDDLMISWASDGGGVGPHFDSYDVFLLQAAGSRRWRIGRQKDLSLQADVPLKILANFVPEEEFLLEPGDMLYLPPRWAHDGVAVGEGCMTYSVGFRVPQRASLASELALRMTDAFEDATLYKDAQQAATDTPALIPDTMQAFAEEAMQRLLADRASLACALGEVMTEPKPKVWFEEPAQDWDGGPLRLDRRTRMMYDAQHIFINGDGFRAAGADARLMRRLADQRSLSAMDLARASTGARELLSEWYSAGWVVGLGAPHVG